MNERKERKSIFFISSLLTHFLLITLLLSMPAKIRNKGEADFSRRVFIDFNMPAPRNLKSTSINKGESKTLKASVSKNLIPASLQKKYETKNIRKEELPLSADSLNAEQPEIPVNFSLEGKNKNEIFGAQNVSFSGNGRSNIISPAGNSKGNGAYVSGKGSGLSGNGEGAGSYYTNYYDLCLQKIEEQKNYPDIAVIRQIEGAVDVKITLDPDGNAADIRIVKSSGWDMLDEEAIRCVRSASPLPAPPEEILSDSRLTLSFTIVFELS